MDFVNVLRGLKKSRSEAKLGLSDRLTVGRKSSKTRIKSGGGGGTPIGDIPEDSTAPSLHSPLHSPARQPYSPPGEVQVEYFTKGEWMLSALLPLFAGNQISQPLLDSDIPICFTAFPAALYAPLEVWLLVK